MARKALLIGSQTGGLSGVDNDIKSMTAALDPWSFAVTPCEGATASRAGILDAYERLITDAAPDDAILIYYSGHGGYCRVRSDEVARLGATMQFIVPADFDESSEDDFRGIMSVELSVLLARLTERTANVTVALDCCHAAHMTRDDGRHPVPKAYPRAVSYDLVAAHLDGLQRRNRDFDLFTPPGNARAVRLVACAPEQSAYEYDNARGVRSGLLTDALTQALAEAHTAGQRVTWSTIIDRVRQRVLTAMPGQRPEAEGPAHRLVFETVEADGVATLPVVVSGHRVSLEGAALLGVRVGDEFAVMPADSPGVDDTTRIGDVVVDEVHATSASGDLRLRERGAAVPLGARAYQTRAASPALPVRLPAFGAAATELAELVEQSPLLRAAGPDDARPVEVREDDAGQLTIWDATGPLHAPRAADSAGITHTVRNLRLLARADALRRVAEDAGHALDTPVEVEFGIVSGGEAQPLANSGKILYLGQRIYLRVRNNGKQTVYVSLLDIGVSSKVTLLDQSSPGGEAVEPGATYTFGWNAVKNVLQGSPLSWPDGLGREVPRQETVIVLVTSQPQNLRALEHHGVRGGYEPEVQFVETQPRSALERLFQQLETGRVRDIPANEGSPVRYLVRTVDFSLVPMAPPVGEDPEFQVDERPEQSLLMWSPRSVMPTTVAVRLSDLTVHHNRAFRSADIRLDAIVLTRGPGKQPVYTATTQRFSNIRDGQLLPLDKMLIYHGAAVDYLDIAVWVSRDTSGSLALADLLQERLTDSDVQLAVGHLVGLLAAAPQVAVAVAALNASAVLINSAYHLLTGIVGQSIGLYRTTLLAGEQFGVGRPADQCLIRAQDFSFRYLIEDVN